MHLMALSMHLQRHVWWGAITMHSSCIYLVVKYFHVPIIICHEKPMYAPLEHPAKQFLRRWP